MPEHRGRTQEWSQKLGAGFAANAHASAAAEVDLNAAQIARLAPTPVHLPVQRRPAVAVLSEAQVDGVEHVPGESDAIDDEPAG
ncbi:MAG: hypothetical protein WDO56_05195 [Gammaproteobacteria bacterium]